MINIFKSDERGKTKTTWLDSKHSFSFGNYHNPNRRGFGKLLVFNEDVICGGSGFGTHPHENAEIVTLVLQGSLKHGDSLGNEGEIEAGEIQRMSAGKGILHSEMNASDEDVCHFLQIWIEPDKMDITPDYEQKRIDIEKNSLLEIVSEIGKKNAVSINQDALFFMGQIDKGKSIEYDIKKDRELYFFVISGEIVLNNKILRTGDSAEITHEDGINLKSSVNSQVLLIDLPGK